MVLVQEAAVLAVFLAMFLVLCVRVKECVYVCMPVQVFFSLLMDSTLTVSDCL